MLAYYLDGDFACVYKLGVSEYWVPKLWKMSVQAALHCRRCGHFRGNMW